MLFISFHEAVRCKAGRSGAVRIIDKWFVNRTGGCEAAGTADCYTCLYQLNLFVVYLTISKIQCAEGGGPACREGQQPPAQQVIQPQLHIYLLYI